MSEGGTSGSIQVGGTQPASGWWLDNSAPAPDTTAPSVPTGLTATATGGSTVSLSWTASTDAVGVTGYEYRVDGGAAVDAGAGTAETVSGLTAATTYSFEVRAYDAAGNRSGWSTAAVATTDAAAPGDLAFLAATSDDLTVASGTPRTFAAQTLGAESPSRHIIVVVGGRSSGTSTYITSLTVGGVTATARELAAQSDGPQKVGIFSAAVPTGTTGDIVVTANTSTDRLSILTYRVDGSLAKSSSVKTEDGSAPAALTVPAGGFAIAASTNYGATASTPAWTGAAEAGTTVADSIIYTSTASTTTAGAVSIDCTWSVETDIPVIAAVAFTI